MVTVRLSDCSDTLVGCRVRSGDLGADRGPFSRSVGERRLIKLTVHLDHVVRLSVGQRREHDVADRERFLERREQLYLGFFVGVERLRAGAGDEIAIARLRIAQTDRAAGENV